MKNIPASILARLRNQTEILERPFAEVLQYYAMERFLFRLSKTKYADKFVLKGGLLFYAWNLSMRRATRDIDFRGYVSGNRATLVNIINEIVAVAVPEDGINLDHRTISVEETQIDADYQGIRVKLIALLERSKVPIQIDIGFSDRLSSQVEIIEYPNILPDIKAMTMKGYPKESVVAEKFHAMVRHGELNSRMKDYYDLWLIADTFDFTEQDLRLAIEATFEKRNTDLPKECPASLSIEFAHANQDRWLSFLNKMDLQNDQVSDFSQVITAIWNFLQIPLGISTHKTKPKWVTGKGWR